MGFLMALQTLVRLPLKAVSRFDVRPHPERSYTIHVSALDRCCTLVHNSGHTLLDPISMVGKCVARASLACHDSAETDRVEKGKGIPTGMERAARQYGSLDKLFGGLTFDLTKNAWRRGGWVDAIVTDPPCESCCPRLRISSRKMASERVLKGWVRSRTVLDRCGKSRIDAKMGLCPICKLPKVRGLTKQGSHLPTSFASI